MKTISAKDLRDNLDEIVHRARQGESLKVTYRSQAAFIIQPDPSAVTDSVVPGSRAAMQKYVNEVRRLNEIPRKLRLDPAKTTKELYRDMLDRDKKYQ